MKIIMNHIRNNTEAQQAFIAVERAISDGILEGRHNFITYTFSYTRLTFSVCKNKDSFTVYRQ